MIRRGFAVAGARVDDGAQAVCAVLRKAAAARLVPANQRGRSIHLRENEGAAPRKRGSAAVQRDGEGEPPCVKAQIASYGHSLPAQRAGCGCAAARRERAHCVSLGYDGNLPAADDGGAAVQPAAQNKRKADDKGGLYRKGGEGVKGVKRSALQRRLQKQVAAG